MKRIFISGVGILLALGIMGSSHAAAIYDLSDDFSLSSNPNGAWSYGKYTGGLDANTFTLFTIGETILPDGNPLDVWHGVSGDSNIDPNIIKNNGASFTASCCGIDFNADKVTFGPFLGPTVARWTAQFDGTFDVMASFATVQSVNSSPNAYIFVDGLALDNLGPITASVFNYNGTFTRTAGQWIDFVVWGGNGANKTTEVSANITAVPEPSIIVLFATGLLAFGLASRKKRL